MRIFPGDTRRNEPLGGPDSDEGVNQAFCRVQMKKDKSSGTTMARKVHMNSQPQSRLKRLLCIPGYVYLPPLPPHAAHSIATP